MINNKILEMYNSLTDLQKKTDLILPIRVSYTIIRNINMLQPIIEDIDKMRLSILEKYGKQKSAEDNRVEYEIAKENLETVGAQLTDLLSVDTPFEPVTIALEDIDNCTLTIEEVNKLYCIIKNSEG